MYRSLFPACRASVRWISRPPPQLGAPTRSETPTMQEEPVQSASTPEVERAGEGVAAPVDADPPTLPATAVGLASKAQDLASLRDVVVEAANVAAALWLSYIFVLLYLLIAVGSVTHRDLLFRSPIRLPFLSVDLPLTGFFVLGPLLFLIVHAYVLMHFVLLAGKIRVFDAELRAQIADEDVRARLRRQLPSNIFVQYLAGPKEVRRGPMRIMLRGIALISLVLGPIALLLFVQLQFLSFHDEAISWWQRIALVIDLMLLWILWPSIVRIESTPRAPRALGYARAAGVALLSV